MVKNPFLEDRMKRLKFMLKFIKENSPIDYDGVLGVMKWNFGVSDKIVKDYIETLKQFGSIEIKDGKIIARKNNEKEDAHSL